MKFYGKFHYFFCLRFSLFYNLFSEPRHFTYFLTETKYYKIPLNKKTKDIVGKAEFLLYYIILIFYPHKTSKFISYWGTQSERNIDPVSQIRAIALLLLLIGSKERMAFE
jgi:hypothetical protein